MEIFLQILVVLVLARLFGEAAERLGQSASVGELLAEATAGEEGGAAYDAEWPVRAASTMW